MSGHSKWANIKNKKEKTDAQRGKIFTKIGREIAIAVKEGGPDPANNKKASGELGSVNYEEVTYEGYGPGGVAVIVEVVTDNRNRTAAEMRHIFDKSGGSMGASGCVAWMFNRKGVIVVERSAKIDEDEFMMVALDAGAEDFVPQDDVYEIYTDPNDFSAVRETLESAGYEFLSAEIQMLPQNTTDLTNDSETVEKFMRLLDRFDDNDDVGEVFHNAILPEEEDED